MQIFKFFRTPEFLLHYWKMERKHPYKSSRLNKNLIKKSKSLLRLNNTRPQIQPKTWINKDQNYINSTPGLQALAISYFSRRNALQTLNRKHKLSSHNNLHKSCNAAK